MTRRLTLVISSMQMGGAQRVMATLANAWAVRGWPITLITLSDQAGDFYALSPAIRRVSLDVMYDTECIWQKVVAILRRCSRLRAAISGSDPDLVISMMDKTNILVGLAAIGLKIPTIVSERTDPSQYPLNMAWSLLRVLTYRSATAVVVQTERVAKYARKMWRPHGISVIPNPIPPEVVEFVGAGRGTDVGRFAIVAMGRLSPEKGFGGLIAVFQGLAAQFPEWDLRIVGEGPLRETLEAQIAALGLAGRVQLPGAAKVPWGMLSKADIVVLSSVVEGFPNALLEAMALGRACVAYDCPSGPREISRDGQDAVLVSAQDAAGMRQALADLMGNPTERDRLGVRATAVWGRYSLNTIADSWEHLVEIACPL